ncbi:uncharacterized protein LOC115686939 [Syzygium oleosum]|uniref:uncharacterized protein LOC115686939 n=1 Tax=Syzygium oleosum TaxID=219896 RepID=UPI0011D269D6|nr:uncharacterized protein LOC115686939 [Syzygium oleosum]
MAPKSTTESKKGVKGSKRSNRIAGIFTRADKEGEAKKIDISDSGSEQESSAGFLSEHEVMEEYEKGIRLGRTPVAEKGIVLKESSNVQETPVTVKKGVSRKGKEKRLQEEEDHLMNSLSDIINKVVMENQQNKMATAEKDAEKELSRRQGEFEHEAKMHEEFQQANVEYDNMQEEFEEENPQNDNMQEEFEENTAPDVENNDHD